MNMRRTFVVTLLLSLGAAAAMADTTPNCWITAGRDDGNISISWQRGDCKSNCSDGDTRMSWSRWTGITPADLQREGASIDARLKGEAGEMRCVGTVHNSEMHGAYSFTPNAEFPRRMETL